MAKFKGDPCDQCENRKAYYLQDGRSLCGYCSARKKPRANLKEPPAAVLHARFVEEAELALASAPLLLGLIKQRMLKSPTCPEHRPGLLVFPNFRARVPKDKAKASFHLPMPQLSPMALGPVRTGNPQAPVATNIENFHQFSKVFRPEVAVNPGQDPDVPVHGTPLPIFYERRLLGFADPEPHRHKLGSSKEEHLAALGLSASANANHCAYAVHWNPQLQQERRYSYVESRQFYCRQYALLARQTPQYAELKSICEQFTVYLCGYDAPDQAAVNVRAYSAELLREWYEDDSTPFGHEKVLLALLLRDLAGIPEPWPATITPGDRIF